MQSTDCSIYYCTSRAGEGRGSSLTLGKKMSVLAAFEVEVLKLMGAPDLAQDAIEEIAREAALVSYEYSGSGYFLTIAHPQLPAEVGTWGEPIVMGHADGVDCGFVLFVGRHEMMIECHTWGPIEVPADFRTKDVRVEVRDDVLQ